MIFLNFSRSTLTWSTLPCSPYRAARPTRWPQKGRQATQAYKKGLFTPSPTPSLFIYFFFFFISSLPPYSSLSTKIPRVPRAQRVLPFSFSSLFQCTALVFSALEVSVYSFFFSYFFCKKLVAILLEMHASAYFIFWNFHKYIFLAIIYDMLSTGKCTYIYIYIYIYFFCF